jgi:glycosyltransferase involved in cell wall biosynthesis
MTRSLDLGCGGALHNPFNADEVEGLSLLPDARPNVVTADLVVQAIPFPDASFDYVTAYDFLPYIPQLVYAPGRRNAFIELMNEVSRVLKPGGQFLTLTPLFPHAVAMRDPMCVNVITEETFPLYFGDDKRWASIYGFRGAFGMRIHERRGEHLLAVMQNMPAPQARRPKVSIFIPVYNAGDYLARTLESALAQTFDAFEVLCIDDGSSDGSLEVLRQFVQRDPRVRVLQTPQNLGTVPRVLNWALDEMRGDYFVYASQDDLFSADWLEKMHARAVETDADAVVPDLVFFHEHEPEKNRALIGVRGDRSLILTGREAMQLSLDWSIPGNALWRAELIRRIRFFDFSMNADEYTGRVLYLNCNKVAFSEGQFLYRQDNARAITKTVTYKTFDFPYTFYRLYVLLKENGFPPEVYQLEAAKGVHTLNSLKPWLEANRGVWSAAHVAEAEQRIARAERCLAETGLLLPAAAAAAAAIPTPTPTPAVAAV